VRSVAVLLIATQAIPGTVRAVYFGVPAALLVYSTVSLEGRSKLGRNGWLLGLGNASYSLYLVHFFASSLYGIAAPNIGLPLDGPLAYSLALCAAILSAFGFH
jgi:peptidoglycan/LPS O-acetylase OafA/YrhL